ncbi:GGDEF domain-containing response regulator [Halomonas denitrificans]|nr:GGDEF domain-containing response regulator [Halomonas denitrificans]
MRKPLHLLVVDDSEDDREHYRDLLSEDRQHEWTFTGTGDSTECLRLVERHHFDCVLLDYSMPGHTGVEVMRRLREKNLEVPVVMLTGQGTERIAVEAMKAGVQDYLPKDDLDGRSLSDAVLAAIEQRETELDLLRRANFDHLTGLASRALLLDRMRRACSRSDRQKTPFGLLFIDLDGFKSINDSLGHRAGDLLLKDVARRLDACSREGDTVARLGGDEFVVIFEELPGDGILTMTRLTERVHEAIAGRAYRLADRDVGVGASIGSVIYPTTTRDREALLDLADSAMYTAKQSTDRDYEVLSGEEASPQAK